MVSPDIAGFIEAQDRQREVFGEDIAFHVRQAAVYPAGTQLDPETGKPYDPTIKPESGGGFTEELVRCIVIFRPIHTNIEDPVGGTHLEGGLRRATSAVLDIAISDLARVQDAAEATVKDVRYKVTDIEKDGINGIDRVLAFLEAK